MNELEFYPFPDAANIGEIRVFIKLSDEEFEKFKLLTNEQQSEYLKSNGTVEITDFSVDYEVPEIEEVNVTKISEIKEVNYKLKYEKCINVIRRFDAGIIGMYDL